MGKGLSKRHRQKLVEAAKDGNLHLAQFGKASATLKPPKAPGKDAFVEHIPASLRKMMALKAAVQEQELQKQQRSSGSTAQEPTQARPSGRGRFNKFRVQQGGAEPGSQQQQGGQQQGQAQASQHAQDAPSTSGRGQEEPRASRPAKKLSAAASQAAGKVYKLSAFDTAPERAKAKGKRKAYYEKRESKKLAKKLKKQGGDLTAAERMQQARDAATRARFGEVADAPLKVQLKRKHWAGPGEGATQVHQQQGNDRCTRIFVQQMSEAERRAQGTQPGAAARAGAQQQQKRQRQQGPGKAQAPQAGGLLQRARDAQARAEKEAVRAELVQGYRAQKAEKQQQRGGAAGEGGSGPRVGAATMQSLAQLVRRGSSAADVARLALS